jgi:hypothetical protein
LQAKVDGAASQGILDRRQQETGVLLARPVIDMRRNGRDTAANIAAFQAANCPRVKLEELFMVIYQVRCNLEHGQKGPQHESDRMLCASAGPIVGDIIELSFKNADEENPAA